MKRFELSRRTFLRGAGGVAIALPFLEIMGCAPGGRREARLGREGRGLNGFPQRFLVLFSGNGTENTLTQWRPTGGELDFQLSPILAPLEAHKQDLLVLDGVSMESSYTGPGDAHQRGMGNALTGTPLLEGDFPGNDGARAGYAGGISADQAIANHIGTSTKLKSLELSVQNFGVTVYARLSYQGSNQPLPPENDPWAVYDRVFKGLATTPEEDQEQQRLVARRRTVLDAVMEDYRRLNARLGAEDRVKLEAHLDAIRGIEARLDTVVTASGACEKPSLGDPPDLRDPSSFPELGRLHMDLLAMAVACDLTRVGSIMFARANNYMTFPWLGIDEAHHDLSHHGDGDAVANEKLTRINRWFAEQMAYLVTKLKAIPEGDGTAFDNTAVFWCNEQGKGNNHSRRSMPYVIAGSAGGVFRTGRYVTYDGQPPHNNLLVSFLNAYGIETSTFGDPAFCTGALGGLT